MNNNTILIKVKQRINKLGSYDFDNIEDWMIVEAFNKVQLEFARRESKKGESDTQTITNIQNLIKNIELKGNNQELYFQSVTLPPDFLEFKRVSCNGLAKKCKDHRHFKVYLAEEANVDDLLRDPNKNPSFLWGETFCTFIGNIIKIYTNNDFKVDTANLIYYRKPIPITISGIIDLNTQVESTTDQLCEFKDDIIELLIDETCVILSGDIEAVNQSQRESQNIQRSE